MTDTDHSRFERIGVGSVTRPDEAKNVLRAEYEFSDDPLQLDQIDGIFEAIEEVARTREAAIVECEDRVPDYKVYWNSKTDTVRIGAIPVCASYEVPGEYTENLQEEV
jgi:hypothetical protein